MTEPDAPPPQDPAQSLPLEQRAESQPWPSDLSLPEQKPATQPPPPPPMMLGMVVPQESHAPPPEPSKPPERAPLPPPYSPPPPRPEPVPFEPLPPGAPPQPPGSPPYSGGSQPIPGAPLRPSGSGWATAAHLTSLFDFGISCFLVSFIGPLIIWMVKKDDDPEAYWHGRESLNFQLNMLIVTIVALPLICACGLGLLILALQPFYKIALVVYASIQAANGKRFRYPLTLRLLND